jgi:hypothetical protein
MAEEAESFLFTSADWSLYDLRPMPVFNAAMIDVQRVETKHTAGIQEVELMCCACLDVLSMQAYALVLDDTLDDTYNHHIMLMMKSWVRMKP